VNHHSGSAVFAVIRAASFSSRNHSCTRTVFFLLTPHFTILCSSWRTATLQQSVTLDRHVGRLVINGRTLHFVAFVRYFSAALRPTERAHHTVNALYSIFC